MLEGIFSTDGLEGSYDVDAVTNAGVTPLMLAVSRNNAVAVKLLLDKGANPFLKD